MRLKISLSSNREFVIDLNHSYHLASTIYRAIERADPSLSIDLHKPDVPKFFTFSKLYVPKKKFRIEGEKMISECDEAYFFFSTLKDEIAVKLVEGLLSKPEIRICGVDFVVSEISVIPEKEIKGKEKFVTLSPIYASISVGENGKRRTVDLYPNDRKFYEVILQNLIRKYVLFYKKTPEDLDFYLKPLNVKAKRIKLKDTFHRCSEMVFIAEGSRELLEVGYRAGFGSKNSMGFGMVKVV